MGNGCFLFSQKTPEGFFGGFGFYSSGELSKIHKQEVECLKDKDSIDLYFENPDLDQQELENDKRACLKWLDSILIVGEEFQSDNYLAIDYSRNPSGPDHPVIFISHEVPYEIFEEGQYDACCVLGNSIDEVLLRAAENPAEFLNEVLGGCTTYSDGKTDNDWFPDSYRTL